MSSQPTTDLGTPLSFHDTHSYNDPIFTQPDASDVDTEDARRSEGKVPHTSLAPIRSNQSNEGYQAHSASTIIDQQRDAADAAPVISAVPQTVYPNRQSQTNLSRASIVEGHPPTEPAVVAYPAQSPEDELSPPHSLSSSTVQHQSNHSGSGEPHPEKHGELGEPEDRRIQTAGDMAAAGVDPAVAGSHMASGARREPRGWEDVEIEKKYHINDPHIRGARTAAAKVITFSRQSTGLDY